MGPFSENLIKDVSIGLGWSLVMAFSLIGWGTVVCLASRLKNRPEWVKGALGTGAFIVLGGLLDYLGVANRMNLTGLTLIGTAVWAFTGGPKNLWATIKRAGLPAVAMLGVAAYIAALGCNSWMFNANWDDSSGYWPVCEQMAVTGTSWAPLALRRALTWGGQFPLQTVGMLFTSTLGGYLYDRAAGTWLVLLCACAGLEKDKNTNWATVAGCLLIVLPNVTVNSTPTVLSALMAAACFVERERVIPMALLIAASVLTRTQMLVPMALLGLWASMETIKGKGWACALKYASSASVLTAALCLPLVLLQKEMFDTYSVFWDPGTVNKGYISFQGHFENLGVRFWTVLWEMAPILGALGGLLAIRKVRPLALVALGTIVLMTLLMPEYSIIEWRRYSWPVIAAALMVAVATEWRKAWAPLTAVAVAACSSLPLETLGVYQKKAETGAEESGGDYPWQSAGKAQMKIPEGRGIVVINLQPAMMVFSRNKIFNWDSFPAVGNPPENPDPEQWREWAKNLGAEYLIMTDFQARTGPNRKVSDLWLGTYADDKDLAHYKRTWYPHRMKGIQTIMDLADKLPKYRSGGEIILDLRPEGSPDELDIPKEEVEKTRRGERKRKEMDNADTAKEIEALKTLGIDGPASMWIKNRIEP